MSLFWAQLFPEDEAENGRTIDLILWGRDTYKNQDQEKSNSINDNCYTRNIY